MKECESLIKVPPVIVLAVNILLSILVPPGVCNTCGSNTPLVFSSTPNKIEALSGSCLHVQCNFTANTGKTAFNSGKETRGAWIRSINDIFDISQGVPTDLLTFTGELSQKNCTTVFSNITTSKTDNYFLRINNDAYSATACSTPLQITVKESPWPPSINIPVGDLNEHQSVSITCSALTPCPHSPPELTWNLQQDSHRQTEKNTDGTFTTKIKENITLSDSHDGYNIRCSARYPVLGGNKTAETKVTLKVSYAPKNTSASISPSGLVSAGSWVELSCSSKAKPPPSFTWFRNSREVAKGEVYSFKVTEEGKYYCVAVNDLGNQRSSVVPISFEGADHFPFWIPLLAVFSVLLLICLMISVWCFKFKHPSTQQTQSRTEEEVYVEMSDVTPAQELNYGEVNFVRRKPEAPPVSPQENEQMDVIYAQVKMSETGSRSAQFTVSPESLYAEVKKK